MTFVAAIVLKTESRDIGYNKNLELNFFNFFFFPKIMHVCV